MEITEDMGDVITSIQKLEQVEGKNYINIKKNNLHVNWREMAREYYTGNTSPASILLDLGIISFKSKGNYVLFKDFTENINPHNGTFFVKPGDAIAYKEALMYHEKKHHEELIDRKELGSKSLEGYFLEPNIEIFQSL